MLQRFRLSLSSRTKHCLVFALAVMAMLARIASVNAALIVNDTWQDSDRTVQESGTDADSDGDIESRWFINSPNIAMTPGHLTSTQPTGSQNWTTYFADDATPITLANAGDKLTVKLVFTPSGVSSGNTSQAFPFTVADTPGAARLTADAAPGTAAYAGYAMYTNFSNPIGNSGSFQLKERTAASSTLLNSGGDWATVLGNGATAGNTGYANGTQYTMTWIMTRTAGPDTIGGNGDDGLTIDVTMAGGSLNAPGSFPHVAVTDATPNTFSYDTFNVRPAGSASTATTFDLNQFQVDFSPVPEPTSLALALCGAAFLWLRRRGR
jgi:hypothetical protein